MGLSICYEDHGNPIEDDIPVDRVLNVLYEPMKIIENIIISLTYAAETNKERHQLNMKIEHKNRFLFTIIFDKKNRYIACLDWQT